MTDKARLIIFSIIAFILLVGAITTLKIEKQPIFQQITQIINLSTTTPSQALPSADTVTTPSSPSYSVSPLPAWLRSLIGDSLTSTSTSATSTGTLSASTTSPTWKASVTAGVFGAPCQVSTATLPLNDITHSSQKITFDYASCFDHALGVPQSYNVVGNSIISSNNTVGGGSNDGMKVADFWILDGKKPQDILGSIINALPAPYERNHCVIINGSGQPIGASAQQYPHFEIRPDDALYKLNAKINADQVPLLCGDYGLNETNSFFEQVGNILLYVKVSQDVPPYDPDSFRQ